MLGYHMYFRGSRNGILPLAVMRPFMSQIELVAIHAYEDLCWRRTHQVENDGTSLYPRGIMRRELAIGSLLEPAQHLLPQA